MGITDIEKSYLIKIVKNQLYIMIREDDKLSVFVIILIRVVIFNINRLTIHLILSILIMNDKKYELSSIYLKQFQERL